MSDGGPAFPCNWVDFQPATGEQVIREQYSGITIRDYFAAKAMQGVLSSCPEGIKFEGVANSCIDDWCRFSYKIADAMLKERERKT